MMKLRLHLALCASLYGAGQGMLNLGPGGAAWTPAMWFLSGEQGAWYDPSDFSTLFQDAAGTTPVTAVEQSVGLVLDKRLGLVRGEEKWNTAAATFVGESSQVSVGVYRLYSSAGAYSLVSSPHSTIAGRSYEVTFNVDSVTVAGTGLQIESVTSTPTILATVGQKRAIVVSTSGATIGIKRAGAAMDVQISGVSIRELPGNHLIQPTAASRPKLTARKNLLLATETLSTQSVTVLATQHVLSFYGTGTITLSGVSTAGPLVGTGVSDRVSLTFTPTAGSLTLTVSGSVTQAQLEMVP